MVDVDELDGARDRRADEDLGRGPEAAAAGSKRDEEGSARVRGDGDIDVAIFINVAHRHRVGARRGDRRRRGEPAAGSEKDLHLSRVANGNVGQPIVIEVRCNDVARCGADERERRCSEARCHTLLSERAAGEHTQEPAAEPPVENDFASLQPPRSVLWGDVFGISSMRPNVPPFVKVAIRARGDDPNEGVPAEYLWL